MTTFNSFITMALTTKIDVYVQDSIGLGSDYNNKHRFADCSIISNLTEIETYSFYR